MILQKHCGRQASLIARSIRLEMEAKRQCFGPGFGLEAKKELTHEKLWLTSSLPWTAFNWPTRDGAKQLRARAFTTSRAALGTGNRTFGWQPRRIWPRPWADTGSLASSLHFTRVWVATIPSTRRSCSKQNCKLWDQKLEALPLLWIPGIRSLFYIVSPSGAPNNPLAALWLPKWSRGWRDTRSVVWRCSARLARHWRTVGPQTTCKRR